MNYVTTTLFILSIGLSNPLQAYVPGSDSFVGGTFNLLTDSSGSGWDVRNAALSSRLDINQSQAGHMVLEAADGTGQMSWYTDLEGPFVYKELSGNFVAVMRVNVMNKNIGEPLNAQFSASGFLIRDPASTAPGNNRWLAYNTGYQNNGLAREIKTTSPATCQVSDSCEGTESSLSTLYLNATDQTYQELLVCRFDENFYFYYRNAGETTWQQETRTPTTQRAGNGPEIFAEAEPHPFVFQRPDLPSRLQVGVLLNAWGGGFTKQTLAEVDWVRFGPVFNEADCNF